jgi:ribonucleotide reductase alpha subunit
MLAALGFSDSAVEAANIYCCGANTIEGAAELEPAHVAVFDCSHARGDHGWRRLTTESLIRMMAAAQPFVSGGVGHTVPVPAGTSMNEIKTAYLTAWRLGLKSLIVEREDSRLDQPAAWSAAAASMQDTAPEAPAPGTGALQLFDGGLDEYAATGKPMNASPQALPWRSTGSDMSQAMKIALIAREMAQGGRAGNRDIEKFGTSNLDEAPDGAQAAETSRQSALDAPRGTASAPSSADAIVEQRQV